VAASAICSAMFKMGCFIRARPFMEAMVKACCA
jgi:hypothetical protein